jgi:hypothetical protein
MRVTCATCMYWLEHDAEHLLTGFGRCTRFRAAMFEPDLELSGELAVILDGTIFKCKPEFVCSLHELPPVEP